MNTSFVTVIETKEANDYLSPLGLKVGAWNQITSTEDNENYSFIKYQAPKDAQRLESFSAYISEWVLNSEWKLLQFDNSNYFDPIQSFFLSRVLLSTETPINFDEFRSFLFMFGGSSKRDGYVELLISNLIANILLYEGHAQIVSNNGAGRILSLQDGYAYFFSKENSCSASNIIEAYEHDPSQHPKWILDLLENIENET